MDILEVYQVDGWLDFVLSVFSAVPAGFLLALFLGLLGFGVGKLLAMFSSLLAR